MPVSQVQIFHDDTDVETWRYVDFVGWRKTSTVEDKPRKIIQIHNWNNSLYALCNDGSLWVLRGAWNTEDMRTSYAWERAGLDIPQEMT